MILAHLLADIFRLVLEQNHMVLCGRCFTVDKNYENRDPYVKGYHYHKDPHERCFLCGRLDDVPTWCCP